MKTETKCFECLGPEHPSEESICNKGLTPQNYTLNQALDKYIERIKQDYLKGNALLAGTIQPISNVRNEMFVKFALGLHYKMGSMYIKVISGSGVHSFIVREDGSKFKKGDILKAATWRAPALNQARGNIFGEYRIRWTGAEYLR